jgi:ABC-type multidrug transport system permease subunit
VIFPMVQLGGLRMPLSVMFQYSYSLGVISLLNPIMFMTEGIRQALFQSSHYLSLAAVFAGLSAGTVLSLVCCLYFFKKRVDHI